MYKRIIPFLVATLVLLSGCGNTIVRANDRAVFAWEGVDQEGLFIIKKYDINTILLDYNHTDDIKDLGSYNVYVLAGSPEWRLDDLEAAVGKAESVKADGIVFDIEEDYYALADDLENLKTDFPVYACVPFWLDTQDEALVERIIKVTDGVFLLNYLKGSEYTQAEYEYELAQKYGKLIWTVYELQPVGMYDLKEYNTYYFDGLEAVEENYKKEFSGTDVGVSFHNLEMIKELDKNKSH